MAAPGRTCWSTSWSTARSTWRSRVNRATIHSKWVHVDFLAVSRTETIAVSVPVHEMEAAGVKEGGVVEHHLREVQTSACRRTCPTRSSSTSPSMELGDMVHVSDLTPPAGVTILPEPEDAVLSIDPSSAPCRGRPVGARRGGCRGARGRVEEIVEVRAAEGEARPRGRRGCGRRGGWRGLSPLPLV